MKAHSRRLNKPTMMIRGDDADDFFSARQPFVEQVHYLHRIISFTDSKGIEGT
jgi:hypothetical protein